MQACLHVAVSAKAGEAISNFGQWDCFGRSSLAMTLDLDF